MSRLGDKLRARQALERQPHSNTDVVLDAMAATPQEARGTLAKAKHAMEAAERKAWLALAGYKFWMFGYHAAQWVLLKGLLPAHVRNPFKSLVLLSKDVVKQRGYKEKDNG